MIIHDISITIEPDMTVYKDRLEKKPNLITTRDFNKSTVYETRLEMDLHTGTHIDMPLHILPNGSTSDYWDIRNCFTRCTVLDFTSLDADRITAADLKQKKRFLQQGENDSWQGKAVLLKTKNSFASGFDFNFVYLAESGAVYLTENQIKGVGIDALGIERDQSGHLTHRALLGSGIWIVEGLRLDQVAEGDYVLVLMPLKIGAVEALPARAVLLTADCMKLPYIL
jgi:arylformamidase